MSQGPETILDKIVQASLRIARHIHDGNFSIILVTGRSNQVSRSLLTMAWTVLYPGESLPKIIKIGEKGNDILYKEPIKVSAEARRKKWLELNCLELWLSRDQSICVLDDYEKEGIKISELTKNLEKLGFKKISTAVFASYTDNSLAGVVGIKDRDASDELYRLGHRMKRKILMQDALSDKWGSLDEKHRLGTEELRRIGRMLKEKKIPRRG